MMVSDYMNGIVIVQLIGLCGVITFLSYFVIISLNRVIFKPSEPVSALIASEGLFTKNEIKRGRPFHETIRNIKRDIYNGMKDEEIAIKYNYSLKSIRKIRSGKSFKEVN